MPILTNNAVALGAPSVLTTWGFDLLKELCAQFPADAEARLIDRNDEIVGANASGASSFLYFSHFASPSLQAAMAVGDLPIILFLDDPADSVRYLKFSSDCSFAEALRIQTAAVAGYASLQGSPAVLAIPRLAGGSTRSIIDLVLNHLRLSLAPSVYAELADKFAGPEGENPVLETSLEKHVEGYRPLDGQSTDLTEEERQIIHNVLAPMTLLSVSQEAPPIVWPTKVFFSGDNPDSPAPLAADLTGGARILYYGPYLHLPAGHWTARMLVGFSAGSRGTPFSIEVHGSKLLARATMVPEGKGIFSASFKFSNDAPYEAIEIRVRTDRGAIEGQFALGRVEFLLHRDAGVDAPNGRLAAQ